ncbi:MAG: glycosyltransferase family 4 protein [Phycisphaerae bacterium]|nr:glycosyltransferase family 4 protein [Phycisphaerae bacterium]
MRIAMIGTRGIPARAGGAERVVEELTRELTARGHEIIVYGRRHYLAPRPAPAAGRVILTPGLPGKHLDAATHTATAMCDVLRRGVDVVHVHSPGPALWSWLPRLAGRPVVLTVHAPDWRRTKWSRLARASITLGLRCGMHSASAVTAVSEPLARELAQRFGREVAYVPNGVRPAPHAPPRRIVGWGLDPTRYVLFVGRIEPEKRLHVLLEAWGALGADRWELVVVGDADAGRYGRRCRRMAPPGVRFVGAQYGPALAELYANAALVVHPSGLEGMSLVLLEAAAYERCILAGDIPANRAVLADAAVYWSGSATELTQQLRRCLDSEALRQSTGRRARQRVARQCDWAPVAEAMEAVYARVR